MLKTFLVTFLDAGNCEIALLEVQASTIFRVQENVLFGMEYSKHPQREEIYADCVAIKIEEWKS